MAVELQNFWLKSGVKDIFLIISYNPSSNEMVILFPIDANALLNQNFIKQILFKGGKCGFITNSIDKVSCYQISDLCSNLAYIKNRFINILV